MFQLTFLQSCRLKYSVWSPLSANINFLARNHMRKKWHYSLCLGDCWHNIIYKSAIYTRATTVIIPEPTTLRFSVVIVIAHEKSRLLTANPISSPLATLGPSLLCLQIMLNHPQNLFRSKSYVSHIFKTSDGSSLDDQQS